VERIPQLRHGVTRLSIVLDSLAQRELSSFDPFHQVPRASVGFGNLLDLCIKELVFCSSSGFAEGAPVLGCFIIPVLEEGLRACVVPPWLRSTGDLLLCGIV